MDHPYPRTERDLRWLAVNFSAQKITRGLPERLECLAAWHRYVLESEKSINGEPNDSTNAGLAYKAAINKMHAAGVNLSEGEHTFSPCLGPDM